MGRRAIVAYFSFGKLHRREQPIAMKTRAQFKQARNDLLEFFSKVIVEPRVEKRIVDRRRHGDDVRRQEQGFVMLELGTAKFSHHVNDVQRQPADGEDHHHGDEHAVRSLLAKDLDFFANARSARQ